MTINLLLLYTLENALTLINEFVAERISGTMALLGIGLGILVAFLWGAGDILATIAARQWNTFKTTFISQLASLFILLIAGILVFWYLKPSFNPVAFILSIVLGIFTGLYATLGYFSLYKALEIGPIAITGPLTATSPIFTLLLSTFILKEPLEARHKALLIIGIAGIALASTDLAEVRSLLKRSDFSLWNRGTRWALIAALAFGALDFGIGASASISNWFLPALWTRFFCILFLALISYMGRYQWMSRIRALAIPFSLKRTLKLSLPTSEDIAHIRYPLSKTGAGIFLAFIVGVIEAAAILTFSFDTRIATTGVTSAIASSYALVIIVFGIIVYHERLALNQFIGIFIFTAMLFLLAL